MQRETRSDANPMIPAPRTRAQMRSASVPAEKMLPGYAGPSPESLTAKMQEYRSWWNLPRSKSWKSPSA